MIIICLVLFCACFFPLVVVAAAENDAVTNGYSYLPISERVKLLTSKFEGSDSSSARNSRSVASRFNTQPVTEHELRVAKIGCHQQEAGRCRGTLLVKDRLSGGGCAHNAGVGSTTCSVRRNKTHNIFIYRCAAN